eukprot:391396_1
MQYPQNAGNRQPLQALAVNPTKNLLLGEYTTTNHGEYMHQSSTIHIDNPCNENMNPSHMEHIQAEVKSAMNNDDGAIHAMQSDFNAQNNNLYLRRQHKSNSICNDNNLMHQPTIPALRIELCGHTNPSLSSANSFIASNDNVLLSSASSIHSVSVGNAYQAQSASSFSYESVQSMHETQPK